MPPAGWFVFGIYLDVYIFLDIFGAVIAHASCGAVCLAGSFLRWVTSIATSICWIRLYIGHSYWDILMRMYLDEMILDGINWTLIFLWENFGHVGRDFFDFLISWHRTKQILCELLNTGLCWMRKTNYIKIIGHRYVLDEKHLTRQIVS